MIELADAEREQEAWFNHNISGARAAEEPKHVQWADALVEEPEEDWNVEDASDTDSDSDSDCDDEDIYTAPATAPQFTRVPSHPVNVSSQPIEDSDEEDFYEDEEEDYSRLTLVRVPSRRDTSPPPPELLSDSDDDSEDDSMPPSPPQPTVGFSEKQRQQIATTSYYETKAAQVTALSPTEQASFFDEGFYLPSRTPAEMVSEIEAY